MVPRILIAGLFLLVLLSAGVLFFYVQSIPDPGRLSDPLWEVPEFTLTNRDGTVVSKSDLEGKAWLAAFIFTRCPGPCPMITRRMSEIQELTAGLEQFRLASFTVDPAFDTPSVLAAYADQWKADSRWFFLTDEDPGKMLSIVQAFKVAASVQPSGDAGAPPEIVHGTHLLLVNRVGQVVAVYDSANPDVAEQVVQDARTLLKP